MLNGGRGLGGAALVVVITFALAAVLMLTGTLIAARQIDDRVRFIGSRVSTIDNNLDAVRLAGRTDDTVEKILDRAQPLSGELSQVTAAAGGIDRRAGLIFDNVGRINDSVGSINRTAGAINANARSINGRVLSINGRVRSIRGRAGSINARVRSINASAGSINGRVRSIDRNAGSIRIRVSSINRRADSIGGRVGTILTSATSIGQRVPLIAAAARDILPVVRRIDDGRTGTGGPPSPPRGAAGINFRADVVTDRVEDILSDTGEIVEEVADIHEHSNSIDCSEVAMAGRTSQGQNPRGRCNAHPEDEDSTPTRTTP